MKLIPLLHQLIQRLLAPKNMAQLKAVLHRAERQQLIDGDALAMIEGVLQVSEIQVRDIMVPRAQMVVVAEQQALTEILPRLISSSHSRIPVIGDDKDEVIGILHAKDLLSYTRPESKAFDIRDVLRPVVVVPESKRLDALLKEFRVKRHHMAIVVDEYGGVSGLITIEDVLEQIVGSIEDEFDIEPENLICQQSPTHFLISALTPVTDFNKQFRTTLSEDEYDTIGGVLMHAFGHMPKCGESIQINALDFEVTRADRRQIHSVSLTLPKEPLN